MLTLQCDIKIKGKNNGKIITLDYVHGIDVKSSCKNLTDTAVVRFPRKMSWNGKPIFDFLRRDDSITIRIGYKEFGLETVFLRHISQRQNLAYWRQHYLQN